MTCAPVKLYGAITEFVDTPTIERLKNIRQLLGMTEGFAVPLTFPAFVDPARFPMVDSRVADWVNRNLESQNRERKMKLTAFHSRPGLLTDNDFPSYVNWVYWCREVADILSRKTTIKWRARDVEMAVFSAEKHDLTLEVI
jgi:hypothetical protein